MEKHECYAKDMKDHEILHYLYGTIDDCANECRGHSTMFAVGTNDFGTNDFPRCNKGKCSCICETSASKDGQCYQYPHNGYRLYKYQPTGQFYVNRIYFSSFTKTFSKFHILLDKNIYFVYERTILMNVKK